MSNLVLVPDEQGNQKTMFSVPTTTKEGNQWLKRHGAYHLKFTANSKRARLESSIYDTIYIEADSVSDICYYLTFKPDDLRNCDIPKADWYVPEDLNLQIRNLEILVV